MKRFPVYCMWLYSRLLRLYPARFRAEYADEMGEVFAQAVSESTDLLSLVGVMSAELRDLPISLIREYLRERQGRVLATEPGGIMVESRRFRQTFHFLSRSLLIVFVVFTLLVVFPFFALGLHLKPALEVAFGIGPSAFSLYSLDLINPNPMEDVAILVMFGVPAWGVVCGVILFLMLGKFWSRLPPRQQFIGLLAVLVGAIPLLFMLLPVGRIVFGWWMD